MTEQLRLRQAYTEAHGVAPSEIIIPSAEQVSKYKIHGLVRIPLAIFGVPSSIAIDVSPLSYVRFAWFRQFAPEIMYVVVSSGKQEPPSRYKPDGFVVFDPSQAVEGLIVILHYHVSPRREIPYDARLEALYRPK